MERETRTAPHFASQDVCSSPLARPLRVAHFIHRYPPALGGAESYFARLSRHLAAAGDDVAVHTTDALALEAFWSARAKRLPAGEERLDGVKVHRHAIRCFPARRYLLKAASLLPWPRLQAFTLPCNPLAPSMWREAGRATGVDVVHASAFPYAWPILCARRLARRLGVPFCLTPFLHLGDPTAEHDRTRGQYLQPALRWLLLEADRVFVQTRLEGAAAEAVGVPAERIVLQGLGVDPKECAGGDRSRAGERWGLPSDRLRVGHLANLSEEKGSCDLLRALLPLWRSGLKVHAVLAGPDMPNFRTFWETLPAEAKAHITRLGVLKDEEKPDFFAALDLFALPSRSDSFGLVLLEAWANGVPCVGYRAGGVAEVIHDEEDGLLAPCGDVPSLTRALKDLLEDEPRRRRYGEAGRARMATEGQWTPKLELVRETCRELTTVCRAS